MERCIYLLIACAHVCPSLPPGVSLPLGPTTLDLTSFSLTFATIRRFVRPSPPSTLRPPVQPCHASSPTRTSTDYYPARIQYIFQTSATNQIIPSPPSPQLASSGKALANATLVVTSCCPLCVFGLPPPPPSLLSCLCPFSLLPFPFTQRCSLQLPPFPSRPLPLLIPQSSHPTTPPPSPSRLPSINRASSSSVNRQTTR